MSLLLFFSLYPHLNPQWCVHHKWQVNGQLTCDYLVLMTEQYQSIITTFTDAPHQILKPYEIKHYLSRLEPDTRIQPEDRKGEHHNHQHVNQNHKTLNARTKPVPLIERTNKKKTRMREKIA